MNKRDAFEIATKIFGIYSAVRAVENIPTLGMAAATYNSEHVANSYLYFGSAAAVPLLYVFLALFFLTKSSLLVDWICGSSAISDKDEIKETVFTNLGLWVRIIGLYYFVMSSGSLLSHISQLGNRGFYWWTPVITKALILFISLWFIFRTSSVVFMIETKSK